MVTLVTFPGSRREQVALLSAVARHCECRRDDDIVQTTCVAHKLLLDERVLDRFSGDASLFEKWEGRGQILVVQMRPCQVREQDRLQLGIFAGG